MDPSQQSEAAVELESMPAVPRLEGPIRRLIDGIERLAMLLAVLALLGLAAVVLLQISARLFLPFSVSWTEELSRYLFIYMVALAAGVVLRRNRNLNVELFQHHLGPRARGVYQAIVCALVGGFALMVVPPAWQYAGNGVWQTSPTLRLSMLYVFFSMVILFALVLVHSVVGLIEGVLAALRQPGREAAEARTWK